jgi:predicted nucleotidyltransferase
MRTLDQINLDPTTRRAITEAAAILRSRLRVTGVVLFGSRARGDATPESDIDLLVLTARPLTSREQASIVETLYPLQSSFGVLFSTIEVPESEWTRGVYQAMPLRREIDRDGVEVPSQKMLAA